MNTTTAFRQMWKRCHSRIMRYGTISILLIGSFIYFPNLGHAQFRDEVFGARPLSLGNAFIGVGGDAYSVFWNPAGIAHVQNQHATLSYGQPILQPGQGKKDLVSFSFVKEGTGQKGTFGIWWAHANQTGLSRENTLSLSYGRKLLDFSGNSQLSIGANLKFLNHSLRTGVVGDRSTLGVDIGLMYSLGRKFSAGALVRNVNQPRIGIHSRELLPSQYGLGSSLQIHPSTLLVLDVVKTQHDDTIEVRGGVETFVHRWIGLRAGGNTDEITSGLSIKTGSIMGVQTSLDYAYVYPFNLDRNQKLHLVSFNVRMGGEREVMEAKVSKEKEVPSKKKEKKVRMDRHARKVEAERRKIDLLLGPNDVIDISVKNHPELEATVKVDPWGYVKLPFVGEVKVKGNSKETVEKDLSEIYRGFVKEPEVEVEVKKYNSRVVYVLGAVRIPGKYPMDDKLIDLREAIVLAGLPTDRAAIWRVSVTRQTEEGPETQYINLHKILKRGKLENNIKLKSGDIIYVPMTLVDSFVAFLGRIFGPLLGLTRNLAVTAI